MRLSSMGSEWLASSPSFDGTTKFLGRASLGSGGKQVFHPHPKTNFPNIASPICPLYIFGKLLGCSDALVLQQLDNTTNLSIQYFKIRENLLERLFCGAEGHFSISL